jgi:hypothetical protein
MDAHAHPRRSRNARSTGSDGGEIVKVGHGPRFAHVVSFGMATWMALWSGWLCGMDGSGMVHDYTMHFVTPARTP